MTTISLILMALFVLFVAVSAARLRRLTREASAQFEVNLRLGGEVQQGLTALAEQSVKLSQLIARGSGECQEAIGCVRAAADRILEGRGESLAPELAPAPVAEHSAPEHLAPEHSTHLIEVTGTLLANFEAAVHGGQVARAELCMETSNRLWLLLIDLCVSNGNTTAMARTEDPRQARRSGVCQESAGLGGHCRAG